MSLAVEDRTIGTEIERRRLHGQLSRRQSESHTATQSDHWRVDHTEKQLPIQKASRSNNRLPLSDTGSHPRLFQIVLAFGNYMNSSKRGPVYGFKLASLEIVSHTRVRFSRNALPFVPVIRHENAR